MILFLIWVLICMAPAAIEYKPVMMTSGWAEVSGTVTRIEIKPVKTSKDDKGGLFDETDIYYAYRAGDHVYNNVVKSLPHLAYLSHYPTDIESDFKASTPITVKYQLDNPSECAAPDLSTQFMVTALTQGGLLCVVGAIGLLIWSVGRSAM